jgi:hypothetical protein
MGLGIGDKKFNKVMHEWGQGKLNSSSGQPVKDQKMALAIAFSEKRRAKGKRKGKG